MSERIVVSINVVEEPDGFYVAVNNGGDELEPTGPFSTHAEAQAAADSFSAAILKEIKGAAVVGMH